MAESSDLAKNAKKAKKTKKCIFLVDPYGTHESKNLIPNIFFALLLTFPASNKTSIMYLI